MPPPFYIVGPTAVGKSELAAEVAARGGGEVIGADAFQVYRGFDLLTAKPSAETLRLAPHHLIGCASPATTYNVAEYHADARHRLADIALRGKRAVVVGGSGLYVKALTHGLSPLPAANEPLRSELDALPLPSLLARLQALDPAAAKVIDAKNKRRVVRALEVCLTTGGRFSDLQTLWTQEVAEDAPPIGVFLIRDRAELHRRIDQRVESIFPAVLEEVRAAEGEAIGATAAKMIGLQEVQARLDGRLPLAECKERIKAATRQYAKRQITWFKRERGFATLELGPDADISAALDKISALMAVCT